ncbi:MAG TPA: Uma2 family endonuclease [Planctomycetaceae bacterium]|jgi:Uma2 family endonuclease|nr:Uma2 family endonuclease [Planctomycetaceae bacterium]
MASVIEHADREMTMADLLERLGGVSPSRVRMVPSPGCATEQDVIDIEVHENRLFELVDGILVEKGMGFLESFLAVTLATILNHFVASRNLGLVTGADGMVRLFPGQVRIPDVAYISWSRIPGGRVPRAPIPPIAPDLAIEVLSDSNTAREMARKRADYFRSGVALVWEIDPVARSVAVYTAPDACCVLGETDTLDGGSVLPGFSLPLRDLFGALDRQAESAP